MSYADYGLDTEKKSKDENGKSRIVYCPFCNNETDNGFSLCFSNWSICHSCLERSTKVNNQHKWIDSGKDKCFKCSKSDVIAYTSINETICICKYCIDWGKEVLNNKEKYWTKMVQETLKGCKVEGKVVKLPPAKLDRKTYTDVKNKLELIGGKWKGGKTQGFVFEEDPTELLETIANGENRNLKKDFQFFATPEKVGATMVTLAFPFIIEGLDVKILEPSAGDGALIKAFRAQHGDQFKIDCYEAMFVNRLKLHKLSGINMLGEDFLQCELLGYYDFIIANPPFSKKQDIDHIIKMYEVCKPGGIIVTLSSPSWRMGSQKKQEDFKMWLTILGASITEIEAGEFKESGTNIATLMICIRKQKIDPDGLPDMKQYIKLNSSNKPEGFLPSLSNPPDFEEQAKQFVDTIVSTKERTCRECGCTDNDCKQCIKKTGKACHWVEEDLCSACHIESPEVIIENMIDLEKDITSGLNELKQMLSPNNNIDMEFFKQLAAIGDIDMTIRIMQKGDKLTINVMPGSNASVLKPILVTGTADELDSEFFPTVFPAVQHLAGLATNFDEVKKDIESKIADKSKPKEVVKPDPKKDDKKVIPAKKETKPAATEPDMFGSDEVETTKEVVNEEEDQTEEENND